MELSEKQEKECIRIADLMVETLDESFMENVDGLIANSEEEDSMDVLVAMKDEAFKVLRNKLTDYISERSLPK